MSEFEISDDDRAAFSTALEEFGVKLDADDQLRARVEIDAVGELKGAGLPEAAILDYLLRRDRILLGDAVSPAVFGSICCKSCTTTICGGTVCGNTCNRSSGS